MLSLDSAYPLVSVWTGCVRRGVVRGAGNGPRGEVVYSVVLFIYKLHTNTHRPRTGVTHACLGWYYLGLHSLVYI